MESKLQELTEKLYREGVSKANAEADTIIEEAKQKAQDIIEEAKKKANEIILDADKKAVELKKNIETEMKLSSKQAINALKQQITDLVTFKSIDKEVSEAINEKDFIKKIIEITIKSWNPAKDNIDLSILLPEENQKEMDAFLKSKSKELLNKGIEFTYSSSIKSGFKIGPSDGSYKISFTDQDFENFFRVYLRPKTIELLYEKS
ncbi:MAG: V-type ATP synthase subunit E [bacterium]